MVVFGAGIGSWIEVIFFFVVLGVMAINKILAARRGDGGAPARPVPRRPEPARKNVAGGNPQAGMNPMEPRDVDQFLDEVLGRGAAPVQRVPPAQPAPVVLRPTGPPPVPQARQRAEVRRPVQRVVVPRPARAVPAPAASAPDRRPRSDFSQSVQVDVDRAASATHEAAALNLTPALARLQRPDIAAEVLALLRSPNDLRRAVLLRELLGPPVALRRKT